MPAYGYVRQSRTDMTMPSLSPLVQEERIRALAASRGDAAIEVLVDLDVSGAKVEERAGYVRLVAAIESGECTAVYAFDLSRLHRNTKEALRFFELCEARGVAVTMVEGNIDTRGPTGKLILTILAAMNAWTSQMTSVKIKASLDRRERETGRRNGNSHYGTMPGEDATVVVDAFRQAGSFDGAARALNVAGVPTRYRGKIWTGSVVASIVRHASPGLVPDAVARGAQAGHGTFALSRVLVCSECGAFLTGSTDKRYGTVRYQCPRSRTVPHPRSWVSESTVMPAVRREAQHVATLATRRVPVGSADDEAALRALDAKRERIKDMYADGVMDKPEYQRRIAEVAGEASTLTARRWLLRVERFPVMEPVEDADGRVEPDPPGRVNAYLRRLFAGATVDMSTPARRGPSQPEPSIDFEWRDPSLRLDVASVE